MQPRLATQPDTAALSSMQHLAAHSTCNNSWRLIKCNDHTPCPPPAQPQIFWQSSLNIPDLPLSFLLLFCQPRMCQTARYIWSGLPHQPSFLPSSTWFYHILQFFFFFKVLSVYLTFQAISSRCSFKESRLALTKFKGKNGCLEYPIHKFLVDFDPLFSDIRLKKFTKPPFSSVFTRFV